MSFGENLQFYRKEKNMTQEQLAEQLGVSRQTVSKWEANTSYPEMEKILQLCELFSCSMDTLLRGEAKQQTEEDTAGYDRHMNQFCLRIILGIELAVCGGVGNLACEAFRLPEYISTLAALLFFIAGGLVLVATGIQHSQFKEKHPQIRPFYKEEKIEAFESRFPFLITGGIGVILAGGVFAVIGEEVPAPSFCTAEIYNVIVLMFAAVGAGILIYAGMQKSKYNIENYNKENRPQKETSRKDRLIGMWCGCIMIFATIVFLLMGFLFQMWEICWIVFVIGGMLCGVVTVIINGAIDE